MPGTKGHSGRRHKPIEVLKLQGTYRKERHEKKCVSSEGIPTCPSWLGEVGRHHWEYTITHLSQVPGLLSLVDRDGLVAYCDAWQRYHDAREAMESVVIETPRGKMAHPSLRVIREAMAEIKHWTREFGMTPSARASIPQPKLPEDADPLTDWMKKYGTN